MHVSRWALDLQRRPENSCAPVTHLAQFHTKRRLATILYLVSIVGTLASAMALHSTILCLVFIFLQTAALLWWVVGRLEGAREWPRPAYPLRDAMLVHN